MYDGYRVIVCIPSGRYRYMRVLLPYLLSERHAMIIDEIHLWVNTDIEPDLRYFERMEQTFPSKIKRIFACGNLNKVLYDADRNHYQFNDSIYRFYKACVDPSCIYVKIDDDICYVHDDFFKNILRSTLARESTNFACVGNVFNIPYVSKLLQDDGRLGTELGLSTGDPRCPIACADGNFAAYIHEQFLQKASEGRTSDYFFSSRVLRGRQRIGTLAWTGRSFKAFGGQVGPQDEIELTTRIPDMLGKPLWMVGDALLSHFAFSHQRAVLEDKTDILQRYQALSIKLNGDVAA
jgi:hypothetical protein